MYHAKIFFIDCILVIFSYICVCVFFINCVSFLFLLVYECTAMCVLWLIILQSGVVDRRDSDTIWRAGLEVGERRGWTQPVVDSTSQCILCSTRH